PHAGAQPLMRWSRFKMNRSWILLAKKTVVALPDFLKRSGKNSLAATRSGSAGGKKKKKNGLTLLIRLLLKKILAAFLWRGPKGGGKPRGIPPEFFFPRGGRRVWRRARWSIVV